MVYQKKNLVIRPLKIFFDRKCGQNSKNNKKFLEISEASGAIPVVISKFCLSLLRHSFLGTGFEECINGCIVGGGDVLWSFWLELRLFSSVLGA